MKTRFKTRAVIDISDIDVSIKMSCDIDIDIENVEIDRHGVIKKVIVINCNLITFSKIIECNCN